MMKLIVFALAALMIAAPKAQAYSIETHKYETMLWLVHAGIDPAIADRISTYAQWVDESRMNSALNPIPFAHARHSRLMHFPTEGVDWLQATVEKILRKNESGAAHGNIQNTFNTAIRDSKIANEVFNEALKTGNPYLMGAAFHVLADSFAHEGFNYIIGHGERGHYPDRPWMFLEKHNEMRKLLFQAAARLRDALPRNALTNLQKNPYHKMNRELTPQELYLSYIAIPEVDVATKTIPHNDPLYVAEAMNLALNEMIKQGTVKPMIKDLVFNDFASEFFAYVPKDANERSRAWDIMYDLVGYIRSLPADEQAEYVDIREFEYQYGSIPKQDFSERSTDGEDVKVAREEFIAEQEAKGDFNDVMATKILHRLVPVPALGDHDSRPGAKDTAEDERLVQREERLQRARWQEVGLRVYGITPTLLVKPKLTQTVKAYMAHDNGVDGSRLEADLALMDKNVAGNQILSSMEFKERAKFFWTMEKYVMVDFATYRLTTPLKWVGKTPYGNLRLTDADVEDAYQWKSDKIFRYLKAEGVYQSIYTSAEVELIKGDYAAREAQVAEAKAGMLRGTVLSPMGQIDKLRGEFMSRYTENLCSAIFTK